jgi:uncharacterized delta-60 repeat protein
MQRSLPNLLAARLLAIFLLLPTLTRAETAVQAWVQRYNGPGNGNDHAQAVAVDSSNNIIVTGYSYLTATNADFTTIKYSSNGLPLWTNRYNGPGNDDDVAWAIAVDGSNNVILTGHSFASAHNADYATIKYSSDGVPLWTNRYNGPENCSDYARGIAMDGSNNVIVTGFSARRLAGPYNRDYVTIKYSLDGLPLWTNRYNGPGDDNDQAIGVAVDHDNNVIVTGESRGSSGYEDYATVKYSSEGIALWTNRYNGLGNGWDGASAVTVDGSNNVIVTGYSADSSGYFDCATIKYSSDGTPLWTNRYNGPGNGTPIASGVTVDGGNNVIVTGSAATIKYSSEGVPLWTNLNSGSTLAVDGSNNVIVAGSSGPYTNSDYTTIKYSSEGKPLWTTHYNGPGNGNDNATALALDRSDNVIVTGSSSGGSSSNDFAVIKYICVPEPVLTGLQVSNGTCQLRVDAVLQSGTLVIEACTNLTGWGPVFTNTTPTNVLLYTDPKASNYLRRFYRAFQYP